MIDIAQIGTTKEALDLVANTVAKVIKLTLGTNYLVIQAEKDTTSPTTEYATVNVLNSLGKSGGRGNTAIHTEIHPVTGDETVVFTNTVDVIVKFHKGDALINATDVVNALETKTIRYQTFGNDKRIGLNGVSSPKANNVPIDQQGWESGAVITMTVNVLSKQVILGGLGVIETVKGLVVDGYGIDVYTDNTKHVDNKLEKDIFATYPNP